MKKRQTTIVDLHYDMLKEILIRVARSSNGAKYLANAISVCRAFQQFVEDRDVLRAVAFDNLPRIYGNWKLFQVTGGLIARSAQAGHTKAQFIFTKIILVRASRLLHLKKQATNKEAYFHDNNTSPAQAIDDNHLSEQNSRVFCFMEKFSPHCDLVRLFLSRARPCELEEMKQYVVDYMDYFWCTCKGSYHGKLFLSSYNELCSNTMENDLEFVVHKFAQYLKILRFCVTEYMQLYDLKKEQLRIEEVCAKEEKITSTTTTSSTSIASSITTLGERIDVLGQLFRVAAAVFEEVIQKISEHSVERANLCMLLLLRTRELAVLAQVQAQVTKAELSQLQVAQAKMVSEFDALMSTCDKFESPAFFSLQGK